MRWKRPDVQMLGILLGIPPHWAAIGRLEIPSQPHDIKEILVRPDRFERPTLWFEARCSIQLSYGRLASSYH
jgi:hypothetical protein